MDIIKKARLWFLRLFPEFRELEAQATTDSLTGLANRRAFRRWFERELALLSRNIPPPPNDTNERRQLPSVSLITIDVDHFKRINDTHGHPAGDAVLVELAKRIQAHLGHRPSDIIARAGGEEFWVVWPTVGAEASLKKAESFCQAVAAVPFGISDAQGNTLEDIKVTVSCGIATIEVGEHLRTTEAFQRLNAMADKALYWAKEHGRNQAIHFNQLSAG